MAKSLSEPGNRILAAVASIVGRNPKTTLRVADLRELVAAKAEWDALSIAQQNWKVTLSSNGKFNSAYPDGAIPAPSWATVPPFQGKAEGTPFSVNVRSLYLTADPAAVITIVGSAPSGWSISGGDNLAYSGTGQGSATIRLRATFGVLVGDSNAFAVQSIAAPSSDVTGPSQPFWLAPTNVTQIAQRLRWKTGADPFKQDAKGLKEWELRRGASLIATVASAAGLSLQTQAYDVGASIGSSSQDGSTITISTTGGGQFGGGIYPPDQCHGRGATMDMTTGLPCVGGKLSALVGGDTFDKPANMGFRKNTGSMSQCFNLVIFPTVGAAASFGAKAEFRSADNQPMQESGSVPVTFPCRGWTEFDIATQTFKAYIQTDGMTPVLAGEAPFSMGASALAGVWGSTNGSTVAATITEFFVNNLPDATYDDSGLTAGTDYQYTLTPKDRATSPNTGTVSATLTARTAAVVGAAEPYPQSVGLALAVYTAGSSTPKRDWASQLSELIMDQFPGSHLDPSLGGSLGASGGMNAVWQNCINRGIARGGLYATFPLKIGKYFDVTEVSKSAGSEHFSGQVSNSISQNAVLRTNYPGGTQINAWYGPFQFTTNASDGCHKWTSLGASVNWSQYAIQQEMYQCVVQGTLVGGPCPSITFLFQDNLFSLPRASRYGLGSGDWNEDGSSESDESAQASFRRGIISAWTFKDAYSGGASLEWTGNSDNDLSSTEFRFKFKRSLAEAFIGQPWSREANGWLQMMQFALTQKRNHAPGGNLIFGGTFQGNGSGVYSAADCLKANYILASSLLIAARTNITDDSTGAYGCTFMYEGLRRFYAGAPIGTDDDGLANWQNNVRRREYDNVWVYVLGREFPATTVTLGSTQYPFTGNGSGGLSPGPRTTLPLQPGQGIVLFKAPPP